MIGQVLIYLLTVIFGLSSLIYLFNINGNSKNNKYAGWLYIAGVFGVVLVSVFLMSNILAHNFTYSYIWEYSSKELPTLLLASTFYAGQQGSFLLWSLMISIIGFFLLPYVRKHNYESPVMFIYSLLLFLLFMILIFKSPFDMIWETFDQQGLAEGFMPNNGRGLNPILQNYWMAIHPPILFVGYSAMTVPFAFAIAGLIKKDFTGWIKVSIPWTLFATGVLGFGIMLGGFWAYETLGWGGFWGWDPVENSSLLPWIVAVALVHTMLVQNRTGGLVNTNFILAIFSFILVLFATFLTRSGVLGDTSVHSFVDPGQIVYLLLLIIQILFAVIGFTMIFLRIDETYKRMTTFNLFSREFLLSMGAIMLLIITTFVFAGTSKIILIDALVLLASTVLFSYFLATFANKFFIKTVNNQFSWGLVSLALTGILLYLWLGLEVFKNENVSTVDISFYNNWNLPVTVIFLILNAFSVYTAWKSSAFSVVIKKVAASIIFAALGTGLIYIIGIIEIGHMMLGFAAFFAIFVNLENLFRIIKKPKHAGAYLSHIGIGLMMLGVLGSGPLSKTTQISLEKGKTINSLGYSFTLLGKQRVEIDKADREKYEFLVKVTDENRTSVLAPIMYWSDFNQRQSPFLEPSVKATLLNDIYISPKTVESDMDVPYSVVGKERWIPAAIDNDIELKLVEFDKSRIMEGNEKNKALLGVVVDLKKGSTVNRDTIYSNFNIETTNIDPIWINFENTDYEIGFVQMISEGNSMEESQVAFIFKEQGKPLPEPKEIFHAELSIKPFINLVWIGVIFTVLGFFLSIIKYTDKKSPTDKEENEEDKLNRNDEKELVSNIAE